MRTQGNDWISNSSLQENQTWQLDFKAIKSEEKKYCHVQQKGQGFRLFRITGNTNIPFKHRGNWQALCRSNSDSRKCRTRIIKPQHIIWNPKKLLKIMHKFHTKLNALNISDWNQNQSATKTCDLRVFRLHSVASIITRVSN